MTTFFDRYASRMALLGIDPCSQKASDMFGVTKAALSVWNIKRTTPKGDTVARIADVLDVSADYLLGRTDDPTDYAKNKIESLMNRRIGLHEYEYDHDEMRALYESSIIKLYKKLDETDKLKAEGVIQGMLMQDKYIDQLQAAHQRTDAPVTAETAANDDKIMNDTNF